MHYYYEFVDADDINRQNGPYETLEEAQKAAAENGVEDYQIVEQ